MSPLSIESFRSFASELVDSPKEAAATLPDKWTAAALLAGGAVGQHVLRKAAQDWKNGRQMRIQQASYGGY